DVDLAPAVVEPLQRAGVDEPELDDVDRNLGIEARAQLLPDELLDVLVAGAFGQFERRRRLLAERVRVGAADAEQVAVDVDREAAAERLRDVADLARRQRDRLALRHHDGDAVALEADRFGGLAVAHWVSWRRLAG